MYLCQNGDPTSKTNFSAVISILLCRKQKLFNLFTDGIRRMGKGNVFTPVCPSVCPHPPPRTCYTAVGMPLAFTQEDFLVTKNYFSTPNTCSNRSVATVSFEVDGLGCAAMGGPSFGGWRQCTLHLCTAAVTDSYITVYYPNKVYEIYHVCLNKYLK